MAVVTKVLVLAAVFLGGGWLGVEIGQGFAPNAPIVWIPSFLMLPLSFAAAMTLWQGLVIVRAIIHIAKRFFSKESAAADGKGADAEAEGEEKARRILRGSAWIMLPAPPLLCGAVGILAGFASGSFLSTAAAYFGVGLAYGLLLWLLAQKDLLFFGWEDQP